MTKTRKGEAVAALILHEAISRSGLTTKEVAHACGVSASMVEKWRSTNSRGCPSYAQLLMLPSAFQAELFRAQNRRLGFIRNVLVGGLEDIAGSILLSDL